eukprot:211667_1
MVIPDNSTFDMNNESSSCMVPDKSICDIEFNMFDESTILADGEQIELFELISSSLQLRNVSYKSSKLIFDAKTNGFTHNAFYSACANKINTLLIIQSYPTADNDYMEIRSYSVDLQARNGRQITNMWRMNLHFYIDYVQMNMVPLCSQLKIIKNLPYINLHHLK